MLCSGFYPQKAKKEVIASKRFAFCLTHFAAIVIICSGVGMGAAQCH
jgi:hypothetical protein